MIRPLVAIGLFVGGLLLAVAVAVGADCAALSPPDGDNALLSLLRLWGRLLRDALVQWRRPAPAVATVAPQPLLVINAGNGRTGTASFVKALARLGLRCYHMTTGVLETPGHLELWTRFLVDKTATIDDVLTELSRAGFNATADGPANFFYQAQMARYPDAAVVLSVRGEARPAAGAAWARSMRESVLRFPAVTADVPFRWVPFMTRVRTFLGAMHRHAMPGGAAEGPDGLIPAETLAGFYDAWVEEVQSFVPAEKLLVFKASDGWGPLCDHISGVSPLVAANCREVLESGEPYPHVNDRASTQRMQFAMRCISKLTYVSFFIIFVLLLSRVERMMRRPATAKCKVQ